MTTKGNEVGQAWFLLCKSVLSFANHPPVLHVFGSTFQDDFLLQLSKGWAEADKPVAPQFFFPTLYEDRIKTSSLPVFRNLSPLSYHSKSIESGFTMTSSQLLQHSLVQPVRPHRLKHIQFVHKFPWGQSRTGHTFFSPLFFLFLLYSCRILSPGPSYALPDSTPEGLWLF